MYIDVIYNDKDGKGNDNYHWMYYTTYQILTQVVFHHIINTYNRIRRYGENVGITRA